MNEGLQCKCREVVPISGVWYPLFKSKRSKRSEQYALRLKAGDKFPHQKCERTIWELVKSDAGPNCLTPLKISLDMKHFAYYWSPYKELSPYYKIKQEDKA